MFVLQIILFFIDFLFLIISFGKFNPRLGERFTRFVERNRKE